MLRSHQFFMPMQPPTATAQMKQYRRTKTGVSVYEKEATKQARLQIRAALAQHLPDKPFGKPLRVTIKMCFGGDMPGIFICIEELPSTEDEYEWKTTRPDVDNSPKLILDEMAKCGMFKNDAHIASLVSEKFDAKPTKEQNYE